MNIPNNIIEYIFVPIACFTIAASVVFVLVRLGSCIYHDHKAARKHRREELEALRAAAIAAVMSVSTPKELDEPKKSKPTKSA